MTNTTNRERVQRTKMIDYGIEYDVEVREVVRRQRQGRASGIVALLSSGALAINEIAINYMSGSAEKATLVAAAAAIGHLISDAAGVSYHADRASRKAGLAIFCANRWEQEPPTWATPHAEDEAALKIINAPSIYEV